MSAHQCPGCPLRFGVRSELEFHLREEHPDFRHDYPERRATPVPPLAGTPGTAEPR